MSQHWRLVPKIYSQGQFSLDRCHQFETVYLNITQSLFLWFLLKPGMLHTLQSMQKSEMKWKNFMSELFYFIGSMSKIRKKNSRERKIKKLHTKILFLRTFPNFCTILILGSTREENYQLTEESRWIINFSAFLFTEYIQSTGVEHNTEMQTYIVFAPWSNISLPLAHTLNKRQKDR